MLGLRTLGDRMKFYERREAQAFPPHCPIVVRVDGKAFHTWTSHLARPYDPRFIRAMVELTGALMRESGAVLGYTQSDEISLILHAPHDPRNQRELWFGGKPQKLASVSAALATLGFRRLADDLGIARAPTEGSASPSHVPSCPASPRNRPPLPEDPGSPRLLPATCRCGAHDDLLGLPGAVFDGRASWLPDLDEATNYLVWRMRDATCNSLQMLAQALYDHADLDGCDRAALHELLHRKGVNWAHHPAAFKRGTVLIRDPETGQITPLPDDLDPLALDHAERRRVLFPEA